MKNSIKYSLFLLLLPLFVGCAHLDSTQISQLIEQEQTKLSLWVKANTTYDPYGNELKIDQKELDDRFNTMVSKIRSSLSGYKVTTAVAYKEYCQGNHPGETVCLFSKSMLLQADSRSQWYSTARQTFWDKGYAVMQIDAPKRVHDSNAFIVPVVFLTIIQVNDPTHDLAYPLDYSFEIKQQYPNDIETKPTE
ncbi:hypothetical protein [Celerinatantimonas sp. MCCC 1A17872]|uniref:hypothetical protein n=1 Tax=Celerinatantimonas sp. MCCC 1A17872 TaxID=3177514 RepID=UPI0038BFCBB5